MGFALGPAKAHSSFAGPVRKFENRIRDWTSSDGGSQLLLAAYSIYIFPMMTFDVQLEDLPDNWEMYEAKPVRQLLPGPAGWLSLALARQLKALRLPQEMPSLAELLPAIRFRVIRPPSSA